MTLGKPNRHVRTASFVAAIGAVFILLTIMPLRAGSYVQDFSGIAVGLKVLGDGTTLSSSSNTAAVAIWAQGNNGLLLQTASGGNTASWKMADLDVGKEIQSFDATFTVGTYRTSAGATPGAGWSLNFGAIPVSGNGVGDGGFVMPNGIVIAWDIYNNGGADNPSIEVFCGGVSVGNFPSATLTESPVPDGGTFTLNNPVSGGTTIAIAHNATVGEVQSAMRAVVGWEAVLVTGGSGGSWTIDRGVLGAYANPNGDASGVLPAGSAMTTTSIQNGTASLPQRWIVSHRAFRGRAVSIHWDYDGLDLTFDGTVVFNNLATPGFVPAAGNKFAFSSRCESSFTMNLFLDDVTLTTGQVSPIETGGPVISEFMAENSGTLEDEDVDSSDWIEIYNGQHIAANLGGWYLTNNAANKTMWQFPAVTIPAYGYKIVWASAKNRMITTGQLHTNFTLPKNGGYVALVRNNGTTIASEFTYGNQYNDVSFGEKGTSRTVGFLLPSTPGEKANYSDAQAPGGPAEDVVWSRAGGLITGSTTVAISAPLEVGAVVRFTTNNTEPNAVSAIYDPGNPPAAFTFSTTTTLRARVFAPGKLPGDVSSRTFLLIDSTLTNYNSSGQTFSSHLPIVVIDSFGVPVDSFTDASNRPYRLSYSVVIDKDPLTGRATLTAPVANFQGRCGTHVRGSSSSGFPQRQYAWELWDNANRDKSEPILGMPANADWILYAPYNDKALMRNFLIYSRMRELTGVNGYGMRVKFCEVFFNQEPGQPVSYADYRGVYVIVEKIKIGKDRVNVAKLNSLTTDPAKITGGYIFKKDRVNAGDTTITTVGGVQLGSVDPDAWNTAQSDYLKSYMDSFEAALNGGSFGDPVAGYQAYIERDSFIDNQWFVEIAKQIDGYRLSNFFWKDRAGKVVNGPLWDYNLALGNANYLQGDQPTGWYYTQLGGGDYFWYPRLHQHTTGASPYLQRHWDRYWEIRRGLWATNTINVEIDAESFALLNGSGTNVSNSMALLPPDQENAVRRHYRRWPVLGTYLWPNAGGDPGGGATLTPRPWQVNTTFQSEVNWMKNWLSTRLAWIDDQYFSGSVIYRPPNLSLYGGNVAANHPLTMSAYSGTPPGGFTYASGTVFYTLDGTDPRGANGTPSATSFAYSTPVILNSSKVVKARLYNSGSGNWSPVSSGVFIVNAVAASAANLVVSELNYNPAAPTPAEALAGYTSGSNFEYIELLNVSGQNVDLSNCQFTLGVLFAFAAADPETLTVPPGGRVLIVENKNAFLFRYGNNPAVKIAGQYSGNLSNSGEQITLLAANNSVIADFIYGDVEPWPVDADGAGYSLVLNNPVAGVGYGNGAGWRSSAQIGGTPGLSNGTAFSGQPNGDSDGDGAKDFFEYATGSDMNNPASKYLPVVSIAQFSLIFGTDNYLKMEYRRNLSADGVNFVVQYSEGLETWSSDGSSVTYVGTRNNGDGTAIVTCRSRLPVSAGRPKMFLQLMVQP